MKTRKVAVVFIQLGENSSSTLIHYAKFLSDHFDHVKLILITDSQHLWSEFPGTVVMVDLKSQPVFPIWWRVLHYDKFTVAGGYWINTLQRLFLFDRLVEYVDPEDLIVHIESDVALFPAEVFIQSLQLGVKRTSVVQLSEDLGIASILIAPNLGDLIETTSKLKRLLLTRRWWMNDMQLLGKGLELGLIAPLSAIPLKDTDDFLTFDGWPFGQYLFGVDGILNGGEVQGGFVSPHWHVNPKSLAWSIESRFDATSPFGLCFTTIDRKRFFLFNLHIHSKMLVDFPSAKSEIWSRAISAANSDSPFPIYEISVSIGTHIKNGNLVGRILRLMKGLVGMR